MISSSLKNMIRDQHVEDEEQQQPPSYASSSSSRERSSVRIINDDNDEGYTSVANHEVVETQGDPPSSSGLKYNIEAEPIDPLLLPEFTSLAQPLGALVEDVHIPVQPPPEDNEGGFCKRNRRTICLVVVVALLLICITTTSATFVIFAFSESRKNDAEPPPTTDPTETTSPTPAPLSSPIVSSGGSHACAIDVLHKLFCWGRNVNGEVGAGSNEETITSPTAIEVENIPKELALGDYHSCMLDVLSKVWCWGRNVSGQLGLGDNVDRNAPKEVISVSAVKISAGGLHTCIITTLKKVWCWGLNYYGQLGTGITSNSNIPIEVVGLPNDISDVSLGWVHTCAIDILSQLNCWGRNDYGQLGLGHTTNKSTPTKVVFENSKVVEVSLGGYDHSCIINNLSQVWCWGYNAFGQIGDGTTTQRTTPTKASLVTAASKTDLGRWHSCAIDNLSDLWCWGNNDDGQLGLGTNSDTNVPTKVTAVDDVVQVSAGDDFTFLVDGNGNIMSMGHNYYGQLGLGDTTDRNTPTLLTGI